MKHQFNEKSSLSRDSYHHPFTRKPNLTEEFRRVKLGQRNRNTNYISIFPKTSHFIFISLASKKIIFRLQYAYNSLYKLNELL